ncbi:MAG TPA: beta-propeller domain-containing protein [Gaiellaceae bacterium]|nr:beta-propeller domain-containing protein [Gaiellaceae bacterium]
MRVAALTKLLLPLAGAATLAAASVAADTAASAPAPRLQRFAGCAPFLDYVRTHGRRLVGPYGLAGGPIALAAAGREAAPVPGVDYSTTNVQEAGVDEPDIVKTDGERIVALARGKLQVVTLDQGKPRLAASLSLDKSPGTYPLALLLFRDRAVVVSQAAIFGRAPAAATSIAPVATQTVLTDVDLRAPAQPRIVRTLTLDAAYVDARLVGSSLRAVFTSRPPIQLDPPSEPGEAAEQKALARNRATVGASRARDWLPAYTLVNRRTGSKKKGLLMGCSHVSRPRRFSGLGVLNVVTFDLAKGLVPVDTDGVMSDGQTVYASQESLYVATQRWVDPADVAKAPLSGLTTTIHKFDISNPLRARYRASGAVAGYVEDQFSMSEWRGVLRVATTELPAWWGDARTESESFVTTLSERGGSLVRLGRVGGLGRGERMYGVRFFADVGYVVTFRQVDPLYTIDLSRPSAPTVRGELKIRGYSAYLHPLDGDLLLGVGQDATEEGRVLGTQVSVFDVADLRRPTLLARQRLDKSWSEVEWDHHAFLYWPQASLAVLPVQATVESPGPDRPFSGAVVAKVGRSAIDVVGTVSHVGSDPVRRSLVIGTTLYTLSEDGLKGSSLTTLAPRSWVRFAG